MTVDPDVGSTGQPYAAFGDNPTNFQDPMGNYFYGGTPGETATPSPVGGPPTCTAGCGPGYVPPPPPTAAQIAQFVETSNNQQLIAEINEAAALFKAAELQQQQFIAAEQWARAENSAGANCDGTDWGNLKDQLGFVGPDPCTPAGIARAGGFIGCPPNAQPCGDEWIPVGSHPVGFNSMNGTGAGPWAEGWLEFLDGCWEIGSIGAAGGFEAAGVGAIPGGIGGCLAGGVGAVGAEMVGKRLGGG